jgi:hypothetical protein
MVFYDLNHTTLGNYNQQNDYYGMTAAITGLCLPIGFSSAVYFGFNGSCTGLIPCPCYGDTTNNIALHGTISPIDGELVCYDPETNAGKGPHAYPYRNQVWVYDLNDWAAVKAGTKNGYDLIPTVFAFTVPYVVSPDTAAQLGGVAYDPVASRVYLAGLNQDTNHVDRFKPLIHVYHIA